MRSIINRICRMTAVFSLAVAFASADGLISHASATPAAEAFVQNNLQRGLQILNSTDLSKDQREEQFRNFLLTFTDLRRVALYTLGMARRTATLAEQDAFAEAFRDYAFAIYAAEFSKYNGQSLRVVGSVQRAPGDELVKTVLVDPHASRGSDKIDVTFRVYGTGSDYRVVDIVVAGLDLAITEQEDFSLFLAQHKNDVSALTANLRQRAELMRASGSH